MLVAFPKHCDRIFKVFFLSKEVLVKLERRRSLKIRPDVKHKSVMIQNYQNIFRQKLHVLKLTLHCIAYKLGAAHDVSVLSMGPH